LKKQAQQQQQQQQQREDEINHFVCGLSVFYSLHWSDKVKKKLPILSVSPQFNRKLPLLMCPVSTRCWILIKNEDKTRGCCWL
jgi:hypothetical protein